MVQVVGVCGRRAAIKIAVLDVDATVTSASGHVRLAGAIITVCLHIRRIRNNESIRKGISERPAVLRAVISAVVDRQRQRRRIADLNRGRVEGLGQVRRHIQHANVVDGTVVAIA
jgi:hypothetical protein